MDASSFSGPSALSKAVSDAAPEGFDLQEAARRFTPAEIWTGSSATLAEAADRAGSAFHGAGSLDHAKSVIEDSARRMRVKGKLELSVQHAVPPELAASGDSSSMLVESGTCKMRVALAPAASGVFAEASDRKRLGERFAAQTQDEADAVLREMVSHELSHCDIRSSGGAASIVRLPESWGPERGELEEGLRSRVARLGMQDFPPVGWNEFASLNLLEESYADVSGAFRSMGEKPGPEQIREAREQLGRIIAWRSGAEGSLQSDHKTASAVASAISRMDEAAALPPERRDALAKEIATFGWLSETLANASASRDSKIFAFASAVAPVTASAKAEIAALASEPSFAGGEWIGFLGETVAMEPAGAAFAKKLAAKIEADPNFMERSKVDALASGMAGDAFAAAKVPDLAAKLSALRGVRDREPSTPTPATPSTSLSF